MTEPTEAELTECYKAANGEDVGKAQPLTTQRIFRAMRAAIAKWGTPPAVGEPAAVKAMGYGGSTGINDYLMSDGTVKAMRPAEVRWSAQATPQPTQAQAGAITPPPIECNTEELKRAYAFGWWSALEKQRETAQAWAVPLTDEQIDAVAESMPGGLDGFLKGWGWRQFAREILTLRRMPDWEPQFDCMTPKQEELAIQFCQEIAGPRGKPGSPPDPVRLLEMAEALYKAERDAANGIKGGLHGAE